MTADAILWKRFQQEGSVRRQRPPLSCNTNKHSLYIILVWYTKINIDLATSTLFAPPRDAKPPQGPVLNMPALRRLLLHLPLLLFCLPLLSCNETDSSEARPFVPPATGPQIVTLGGDIAEIVFALGMGDHVVGADRSSTFPDELHNRPRLNYHRQTSAESVLSLNPTHVFLTEETGPPPSITQIEESGVEVIKVPNENSLEGITEKIRFIAEAIDKQAEGEELIQEFNRQITAVQKQHEEIKDPPAVIFLYARQGMGAPMVGGNDSEANTIISLAGGENAASELQGFKALTPEALVKYQPACILMMEKGFEAMGGEEGLLRLPGMADTPAGKNRNFVTLPDNLILTYGPRTPEAVSRLAKALHGEAGV